MHGNLGENEPGSSEIIVVPWAGDFVLWRCLHGGPLSAATIERVRKDIGMPWAELRARNVPLLERLAAVYGAYAIVARAGEEIVGQLRFYPKAVCARAEAGLLCLQQRYPNGPSDALAQGAFPPRAELADKTLVVHCLMTGNPAQKENPYQRRGLGTRLAQGLVAWATAQGWQAIEATAYEDLPTAYAFTGQAGKRFWEKLGFHVAAVGIEPELGGESVFAQNLRTEAAAQGLAPEQAQAKYTMRRELG
jgi:GNAT superfamily N-acetyltransferase